MCVFYKYSLCPELLMVFRFIVFVYKNGSTLLLWICRFNYDSSNIPPCVYHKQSLSMEMNNLLCTSPTVWHFCGFPGSSGEQWGPNEEESPGASSKVLQR